MRHLRVFRLRHGELHVWIVAAQSLRDDETWDEIYRTSSRSEAFGYIDEVTRRNEEMAWS